MGHRMQMAHRTPPGDGRIDVEETGRDRRASLRALKYWQSCAEANNPPLLAEISLTESETGLDSTFLLRIDIPVDRCVVIACSKAMRRKLRMRQLGDTFLDGVPESLREPLLEAIDRAVMERRPQLAEGGEDEDEELRYRAAFLPVADIRSQICYLYAVYTDNRPSPEPAVH